MSQQYSQFTALMAITKASFRAIFKSPSSIFFSLFFPIVLILVFGSIGGGGGTSFDIAIDNSSDTTSSVYKEIAHAPIFDIVKSDTADINDRLMKGRITAVLAIHKKSDSTGGYDINIKSTSASQQKLPALKMVLNGMINEITLQKSQAGKVATISEEQVPGRIYKMIDFYLPSMIGFSLIGSAVFGVAFLFFSLRETLVLKRMFASPVSKTNIVLGEALGRIVYQMITVFVLILFGKYMYGFTLSNGALTFIELVAVSLVALVVFMGFGFFVSSVAKNQNLIPIYANLFMFPQYFLSGTFFPKSALPQSVQWLIEILPLTALNDALRKISFEGAHIADCWRQLGILGIWGVLIYALTIKVFRWE